MIEIGSYRGRHCVVTGCASGIGAAVAALLIELGADVYGFDSRPTTGLTGFQSIDLGEPGSIARAAHALPMVVDALFNCAGLAPTQGADAVLRVNYLGMRTFTDHVVERMAAGGAIVGTASNGGLGWKSRLAMHRALAATEGFDGGLAWLSAHADDIGNAYAFGKEALIVWTFSAAQRLIARGIRINCTSPGAVATPMLAEIEARVPAAAIDATMRPIGRKSTVAEQAWPLVWLNSPAAAYINGVNLPVDGGFAAAHAVI